MEVRARADSHRQPLGRGSSTGEPALPGHPGDRRRLGGRRPRRDAHRRGRLRLPDHAVDDDGRDLPGGGRRRADRTCGARRSRFIEPESEHSSASAAEGVALAGGRVTNFTAGQGLVLMKEVLYVISGKRLPVVFHVGARALTSQALNIHAGHDDVMAVADTGWGILVRPQRPGGRRPDRHRPPRRRGDRDAVHRRPGRLPDDPHARERAAARGRAAARVRRRSARAHPRPVRPGRGADDRRRPEPGQLHEGPHRPARLHGPHPRRPGRGDGRVGAPDRPAATASIDAYRCDDADRDPRRDGHDRRHRDRRRRPPARAGPAGRLRRGHQLPAVPGRGARRGPATAPAPSASSSGPTSRWPPRTR